MKELSSKRERNQTGPQPVVTAQSEVIGGGTSLVTKVGLYTWQTFPNTFGARLKPVGDAKKKRKNGAHWHERKRTGQPQEKFRKKKRVCNFESPELKGNVKRKKGCRAVTIGMWEARKIDTTENVRTYKRKKFISGHEGGGKIPGGI